MSTFYRKPMPLIWIRSAGDLATGVAVRLLNSGFPVICSELPYPTVIRRTVAFAAAVYDGQCIVEGHPAVCCDNLDAASDALSENIVPVYTGDECLGIAYFKPDIFIEATIRKVKTDIPRDLVFHTIALGPGYSVPEDVDLVIETMRGHYLGKVITKGMAIPDTGVPGEIAGYGKERVIHAPAAGQFVGYRQIGDQVLAGDSLGSIYTLTHEKIAEVQTTIPGTLRGIIQDQAFVHEGMKIADVDPRCELAHCYSISDKARAVGGGVLEAVMMLTLKNE